MCVAHAGRCKAKEGGDTRSERCDNGGKLADLLRGLWCHACLLDTPWLHPYSESVLKDSVRAAHSETSLLRTVPAVVLRVRVVPLYSVLHAVRCLGQQRAVRCRVESRPIHLLVKRRHYSQSRQKAERWTVGHWRSQRLSLVVVDRYVYVEYRSVVAQNSDGGHEQGSGNKGGEHSGAPVLSFLR